MCHGMRCCDCFTVPSAYPDPSPNSLSCFYTTAHPIPSTCSSARPCANALPCLHPSSHPHPHPWSRKHAMHKWCLSCIPGAFACLYPRA